ncbi:hypothetical protein GOBAR_DD18637 [Gossypium barbadense]|nr:hypothetical protein GOBAR_DD18637 [Gossypium barbadense]
MSQPNHQNLSAETKTHTMLEKMMKMMSDQKKETDGRFQALEIAVKQLQTRVSSTDVKLGNLDNVSAVTLRSGKELIPILKKVQNSNEESETKVKRVRFGNRSEENLAMPKADSESSQADPREAEKSHPPQSIVSHDATNLE